jgi:hypothetical protein
VRRRLPTRNRFRPGPRMSHMVAVSHFLEVQGAELLPVQQVEGKCTQRDLVVLAVGVRPATDAHRARPGPVSAWEEPVRAGGPQTSTTGVKQKRVSPHRFDRSP